MAAKLQCEICGGKLIGRPGGIYECDSCGMEYDTAWAKAKIQEITGTVKVEGTVEVTGKVQIDGPVKVEGGANKEALLKRGMMALEESKWDDAKDYFNQALNYDAEYGEAYLGLAMAEANCQSKDKYAAAYTLVKSPVRLSVNTMRARKYASTLSSWFASLDEEASRANEKARIDQADAERKRQRASELAKQRLEPIRQRNFPASRMISAGDSHTVGLKSDGTVISTSYTINREGYDSCGRCEVKGWKDVVAITSGDRHTLGLKSDGTVISTKFTGNQNWYHGQCEVSGWTDIVAIAAGGDHSVGLRANGTVVATKYTGDRKLYKGQCEVSSWRDIVAIAAGERHTVGLKSDGTVVSAGDNSSGQCRVGWRGIVAISAAANHTVGLRADGTVVATGDLTHHGENNVSDWKDIVAIAAGLRHTVGLRANGTVVATKYYGDWYCGQCDVKTWTDIVAISAGCDHTVGVKADGSVVSTRYTGRFPQRDYAGQCEVSGWRLFNNVDNIEAERKAAAEKIEAERRNRIAAYEIEQNDLRDELDNLKGLFSGKRRREIEARLAEIEAELKKLG